MVQHGDHGLCGNNAWPMKLFLKAVLKGQPM